MLVRVCDHNRQWSLLHLDHGRLHLLHKSLEMSVTVEECITLHSVFTILLYLACFK